MNENSCQPPNFVFLKHPYTTYRDKVKNFFAMIAISYYIIVVDSFEYDKSVA